MRKQPTISAPTTVNTLQPEGIITQVREYELITPLFGGGVQKGENDSLTLIRGSEIRGILRFWWRACRGGQFNGNLADMKKKEDEIWGTAYKKGTTPIPRAKTVQITVQKCSFQNSIAPYDRSQPSRLNIPLYAAFPLQLSEADIQAGKPQREVKSKASFTLIISFPEEYRKDIEATLWAWETFGGIGARTRRGFGTLRCKSIQENQQIMPLKQPLSEGQASQWMQSALKDFVADGIWPCNVPHLSKSLAEGTNFKLISRFGTQDALSIWSNLINTLKSFRQMRYVSTNQENRNPGRSMWPEPSTIRHLTSQSLKRHTNPIPNPPIYKFPRAAFGLPIIFQFKDRNKRFPDDRYADPRKTVLQIKNHERFASPLILKPLSCQNGKFIGLALLLEGTKLPGEQLELQTQEEPKDQWDVQAFLEDDESLTLTHPNGRLQTHIDKRTDILRAFLSYL